MEQSKVATATWIIIASALIWAYHKYQPVITFAEWFGM